MKSRATKAECEVKRLRRWERAGSHATAISIRKFAIRGLSRRCRSKSDDAGRNEPLARDFHSTRFWLSLDARPTILAASTGSPAIEPTLTTGRRAIG